MEQKFVFETAAVKMAGSVVPTPRILVLYFRSETITCHH